jgi:hypothetical protein
VAYTTGVISADVVLDLCYKMIAAEQGILKKRVLSRMKNTERCASRKARS